MSMKRQIRKVGAALLVVTALCSMTSCGREAAGINIVEEAPQDPQYIGFFASNSLAESDLGKYWSDRFMELYDQQVYVNYDGAFYYASEGLSYRELLEKRLESASPDDVYIINAEDVLAFEKKGYWMDLSELDFVENLSDAARYQSTYNGKVFSVPLTFNGFGFCWNLTLLKEQGMEVPENRKEFMEVCQALKDSGILPYGANRGYALTVPAMAAGFSRLYGASDQEQQIEALNRGETRISSYMSEGFEFLAEMIEKGFLDPDQAMNAVPRNEDVQLFQDGGCAFICADMGIVLQAEKEGRFEIAYTGLPALEDGFVAVYGADSRLCVNPRAKNLEAALKFVEMVGTREALDQNAVMQKKLSSAKDSTQDVAPVQKAMFKLLQQPGQIPNQDFALHFNTWESIRDRGREICGGASAAEASAKLDELQRVELENYAGR